MCGRYKCPECQDRLIHQSKRGSDESSSAFGQWIHDDLTREMFTPDIDTVVYKARTRILRVIEHKPRGMPLRRSQETVLPLLAKAIQLLAATRLVHPESGVFMVQADPPFESARVRQIDGWTRNSQPQSYEITGTKWISFMEGEVVDLADDSHSATVT